MSASASARRSMRKKDSTAALDESTMEELQLAFDMFDEGNNGYLTEADVKTALDKYGIRGGSSQAKEMFKEADVSKNGQIGFPEFMSMMARRMKQTDAEEDLLEAFRVFDPYGDGQIDQRELTEALTQQGDKLSREEMAEMLEVCLVDGQVSYPTFVKHMFASQGGAAEKK